MSVHTMSTEEARERHLSKLSRLLTGGLWINSKDDEGCTPEGAIIHVAAAQLKAVMVAMASASTERQDPEGWSFDPDHDKLTHADVTAALSGIVAFMQCAPDALEELARNGEFRASADRHGTADALDSDAEPEVSP